MKKITLITLMLFTALGYAQVGINTNNPDASSALEIESTSGGILIPRMTELQRDAIISPATGLMVYQNDNNIGFYFYNGAQWTNVAMSGPAGPQGEVGPQGQQGPPGADGQNGAVGPAGTQGEQGIQGPAGPQGQQGEQGPAGADGQDGAVGPVGAGGQDGAVGPAGPQGIQGPAGADGQDGVDGTVGPSGPQGEQGIQGPAGPQGQQGEAGSAGNGIASSSNNGDGTFTLTFDDGTTFTTDDLTGPQVDTSNLLSGPNTSNGMLIFDTVGINEWIVPSGIYTIEVWLNGSLGGDGGDVVNNVEIVASGGQGGSFGSATAILNVLPGDIITCYIGNDGVDGNDAYRNTMIEVLADNGSDGEPSQIYRNYVLGFNVMGGGAGIGARVTGSGGNTGGFDGTQGSLDMSDCLENGFFPRNSINPYSDSKSTLVIRY